MGGQPGGQTAEQQDGAGAFSVPHADLGQGTGQGNGLREKEAHLSSPLLAAASG